MSTVTMREKQSAVAPIHTCASAVENTSQLENDRSMHIWPFCSLQHSEVLWRQFSKALYLLFDCREELQRIVGRLWPWWPSRVTITTSRPWIGLDSRVKWGFRDLEVLVRRCSKSLKSKPLNWSFVSKCIRNHKKKLVLGPWHWIMESSWRLKGLDMHKC